MCFCNLSVTNLLLLLHRRDKLFRHLALHAHIVDDLAIRVPQGRNEELVRKRAKQSESICVKVNDHH